jgi:hypothetical protein
LKLNLQKFNLDFSLKSITGQKNGSLTSGVASIEALEFFAVKKLM